MQMIFMPADRAKGLREFIVGLGSTSRISEFGLRFRRLKALDSLKTWLDWPFVYVLYVCRKWKN